MNVKRALLAGLLGITSYAAIAAPTAQSYRIPAQMPENARLLLIKDLARSYKPMRDGLMCVDLQQAYCHVGLLNGDFENLNVPDGIHGWYVEAGDHSPVPYLGKTPESRVLALPGRNSLALAAAVMVKGSTSPLVPTHSYTVKLRARGSGALPAQLVAGLSVVKNAPEAKSRELASATQTVGWDWVDMEFKVNGVVQEDPALMVVTLVRTDNHASTLLQVDDVRIERVPLHSSGPAMGGSL